MKPMSETLMSRTRIEHSSWRFHLLLVFAVLLSQTGLNFSLKTVTSIEAEEVAVESTRQLHPQLLRIMSFGHTPLAADWLWLQFLVDPSTVHVKPGQHAANYYRAELITELDPAFFEAYMDAGQLLAIVRNDIQGAFALSTKAERFMEKSLPDYPESFQQRFWRDSWLPHVFTAYLHLFDFDDLPKAATAFKKAALVPGAPEYLERLRERLEKPGGQYEVGLRLLNFMIQGASDDKVKAGLEEKRRSLFLSQYLFELNNSFRDFLNSVPTYRSNPHISAGSLQALWSRFLRETRTPAHDPFGGRVFLSPEGQVTSTTPRSSVFGLK